VLGTPVLASVINRGLQQLHNFDNDSDYVLVLGADHVLPGSSHTCSKREYVLG